MGKSTRRKLQQAEAVERAVLQPLRAYQEKPAEEFSPHAFVSKVNRGYDQLRSLEGWVYRGKSSNFDKHKIALIRHVFARYRVPRFLEEAFISDDLRASFSQWYIAVAQGESLYKTATKGVLTKQETHLLLQAPENLTIKEAIWWAKSMALTNDIGISYRLARSPITLRGDYRNEFWVDVHRFFANNPVPMKEMAELIDYVVAARQESDQWTIKKRSLDAVRRGSEKWHRDMAKMKQIGGGSWTGMSIDPWTTTTGRHDPNPSKSTFLEWEVREILTGNDLAKEGNQMRHCVFGYKSSCVQGHTAIFSMTSKGPLASHRNLTIEVITKTRTIVQSRGLANRMPRPQEVEILNKWARANNLRVGSRW